MRNRNSKLAPVLRAMNAYVAMQTAEPQPGSVPEPDEYGYWTRRPDGGLHYHAYDPATEDDELADHLIDGGDIPDEDDRPTNVTREWGWEPTGTTRTYDLVATEKRAFDWIAYRCAEHGDWEAGHTEAEALGKLFIRLWREEHPVPVTCARCGAVVDGDALTVQTAADGSAKLDNWYCRAHLVAGTERLKAAIRTQREGDA